MNGPAGKGSVRTLATVTPETKKYVKISAPDYDVTAYENDRKWIAQGKSGDGSDQTAEVGDMVVIEKTGKVTIVKKDQFQKEYKAVS